MPSVAVLGANAARRKFGNEPVRHEKAQGRSSLGFRFSHFAYGPETFTRCCTTVFLYRGKR